MIEDEVKAVLHATRHPLLTLDAGSVVLSANRAFYSMLKTTPAETEGLRFEDLGGGQWSSPELRGVIARALEEQTEFRDFRVRQDFPGVGLRTLLVDAVPMKAAEGPSRLLLGFEDITDREAAVEQLEAEKAYAENVVETIHEGVLVLSRDLIVEAVNTPFCKTFDVQRDQTVGRKIFDLGNGQWDVPLLRRALERILSAEKEVFDWEVDHVFGDIGRRIFTLSARRLVHQPKILVVVHDITKQRLAEREEVLRRELQHRIRNIYFNVQALSRQTASSSDTLAGFIESFENRVAVLSRSNELIVRHAADGVPLHELVRTELDARGAGEGADYVLHGSDARIGSNVAQMLGSVLHELATNAVKYGALRQGSGGALDVSTDETDGETGPPQVFLRWRERGVSIPEPPKRTGYGMRLITKVLPHGIGGSTDVTYHPDGVEVVMRFPNTFSPETK